MNTARVEPFPSPRPFLGELEAYVPGEQPREAGFIKLNTNEFPYPAAPEVVEAVAREAADTVRIYPDPTSTAVREVLAARHGVEPSQILVGNGSDEILRLLAHGWLGAGRRLAVVSPSYTLYEVLGAQFESQVDVHALEDCEHLPESLFSGDWDACFLASPNPPIGTVFPSVALTTLAEHGGLLVLDGAYVDFSPGHEPLELLEDYPNVVITRTFSKSFGLAGMRVGYAIGHPSLIATMQKLRDSYNVNRVSQAAARAAVMAGAYYRLRCDEIIESRARLAEALRQRGFIVPESHGNFVFARHPQAPQLYAALKERKILVRYFSRPCLADGMRITIGTPAENDALLAALDQLRKEGLFA